MTALVTSDQIREYRSLTTNINEAKSLTPYILEAQEFDLRPFLGTDLYLALLADYEASPSLATPIYADLYNGSTYTYGSRTYKHEGIVPVLVYFAYARYLDRSGVHSTKYGPVQKENEFSTPVSEKTLARMIGQAKSGAVVYQDRVLQFLRLNASDYPLWFGSSRRRKGQVRITAVGGNSKRGAKRCEVITRTDLLDCGDDYVESGYVE